MATRQLEKSEFENYFNRVGAGIGAATAEVEVASLNLGDQIEAEWLPLQGLAYDPRDDVFEIILGEAVDHLVLHPQELYVEESPEGLHSLEVVERDGTRHILKLKKALALPRAS